MKENKKSAFGSELPEDAAVIKQLGPWDFYFSKSEYSLFVATSDYHAGPLRLSQDDLLDLAGIIERA